LNLGGIGDGRVSDSVLSRVADDNGRDPKHGKGVLLFFPEQKISFEAFRREFALLSEKVGRDIDEISRGKITRKKKKVTGAGVEKSCWGGKSL